MLEHLVHCRESEVDVVMEALGSTYLLDWSRDFIFYYLPDHLLQLIQGLVTERDVQNSVIKLSPNNVYVASTMQEDVKCPEDVSICILGEAGVHKMVSTWVFHKNAVADPYLRLARDKLALGVYTTPGTPIKSVDITNLPRAGDEELPLAWMTVKHWGDLGLMMTHEQHRRRGLGSLLIQATAKLAEHHGYVGHACARDYNTASKNLMAQLGWKVTHRGTCLLRKCEKK
ncbi:unnamed protein product [Meganyctiphanes norvegica]|uniref:GCN5-related N-acetyltransferase Rv2170-like domain-containing protein n=1 Tax=Meganyctiphanes norvegica TaxID=48144 RepID=A0AAV2SVX9_MEGNR